MTTPEKTPEQKQIKTRKLLPLALSALAAMVIALPAKADLASNLRHTPASVDSFVSLSTSYEDWRYFLNRKPFAQMLGEIRQQMAPELETQLGMNFDKDLAPMLGTNLNIAFYDEELNSKELLPMLLIFDLKDTSGFPKLVKRLQEVAAKNKNKQLLESKYQGVSLYGFASTRRTEGVPYMALSNRTLLIGSKTLVMKAIDSAQSRQPAALSDQAFKVAHDALRTQKLWAWANPEALPAFMRLADRGNAAAAKKNAEAAASLSEAFEMYDSVAAGLDISRTGLVVKTVVRLKEQGLAPEKQALMQAFRQLWNDPGTPMQGIMKGSPARPLFFAGINGMQLVEQSMQVFGSRNAEQQKTMASLAQAFEKFTQLDFHKDILSTSDGRGGVAVFYPEDTKVFNRPPQVVFFLGVKDNSRFLQTLTNKLKLDLSVLSQNPKPGSPPEIITFPKLPSQTYLGHPLFIADNSQVTQKLRASLFMQPAYSHVGNVWLFASSPEGLKAGIDQLSGKRANLNGSTYFNQLKDRYGLQSNGGLVFIELSSAVKLAELLGGGDDSIKQLKPTLLAFKSILA
ncbi:MAG: DUF3352 domain-containing protein, partial [Candidatus Sericytochromatia bacterium]